MPTRVIRRLAITDRAYTTGPNTFSFKLALRDTPAPTENVTVTLSAANSADISITTPGGGVLTFTPGNYATPQQVTVTLNTTPSNRTWGVGMAFASADANWDDLIVEPEGILWGHKDYTVQHHITDLASVSTRRANLINAIWPGAGGVLPTVLRDPAYASGLAPNITKPGTNLNSYLSLAGVTNLLRKEEIQVYFYDDRNSAAGLYSNVYAHLIPKKHNGKLLIFSLGHSDNANTIGYNLAFSRALAEGCGVLICWMPLRGSNLRPSGITGNGHDQLDNANTVNSLYKLFLDGCRQAVQWCLTTYPNHYDGELLMSGLSGGGWLTLFYSAVDVRVKQSISFAGYVPVPLRLASGPDEVSDIEQRKAAMVGTAGSPLSGTTSYEDLMILAAIPGRTHYHGSAYLDDTICTGLVPHAWRGPIRDKIESLGGNYEHIIDLDVVGHQISQWEVDNVLAPLIPEADNSYSHLIDDGDSGCTYTGLLGTFTEAAGKELQSIGTQYKILPLYTGSNPHHAEYVFSDVPLGTYSIDMSWETNSNRATGVRTQVLNSSNQIIYTPGVVNQEIQATPLDAYGNTYLQELINGVEIPVDGIIKVRVLNSPDGTPIDYVCFDSIRIRSTSLSQPAQNGEGTVTGTATVTATGTIRKHGQGTVNGAATVTAAGRLRFTGHGTVSGVATVTADGTKQGGVAGGTVNGTATVTAIGTVTYRGRGMVAGVALCTATGTKPGESTGLAVNTPNLVSFTPIYTLTRVA